MRSSVLCTIQQSIQARPKTRSLGRGVGCALVTHAGPSTCTNCAALQFATNIDACNSAAQRQEQSHSQFKSSTMRPLKIFMIAPGVSILACRQEGQCRELSGDVQVCASGYWQDTKMDGYSCRDGMISPNALPYHSDLASVIVGPPVQMTRQNENNHPTTVQTSPQVPMSIEVESTSLTSGPSVQDTRVSIGGSTLTTSLPQQNPSIGTGDVGHWYCNGEKPPTRNNASFMASYALGGSMASVYFPLEPVFSCNIQPPASNYFVAVWTRFVPGQQSQPKPKNCNDWLSLENPKNGRAATALVIDRCASCVGVGHQMSDSTVSDTLVNGATIDLSPELFSYLYEGAVEGVFDVLYNGSIYGGSWDGDPDDLKNPSCDTVIQAS